MIKRTLMIIAATTVSTGVALAEWTLVDDMEYADQAALEAGWSQDPVDGSGDPVTPDGEGGGIVLAEVDGNKVLQFNSGAADLVKDTTYNARAVKSIPEIAGTGTVYFKINVPTVDVGGSQFKAVVDLVWGLSWRAPIADPLAPDAATEVTGAYGDYSVIGRVEFDNSFDFYDNGHPNPPGAYQTVLVDGPTADEWYQIWFVLDHANNAYKVYVQGGTEFPTQTLVALDDPDTHPPIGWLAERSPSLTEPLRSFLLYSSAGSATVPKGLDYMYIDDIYVDVGNENLSVPSSGPISDAEFDNISTRGVVGTGPDRLIAGFVVRGVEGSATGTVLVRAVGPGLTAVGINSGFLEDPVLDIFQGGVIVYSNDNWGDNMNADEIKSVSETIGAFALEDGSADAVLMLSLPPGVYTARIGGKDNGTGIAIVEVYAVD
ncbi:MAG: hypothetical protein R3F07_20340 [Opitutaceae bacterium]